MTITGPNGAGKSTLLHLMSLHMRPDRGAILYCGTDSRRKPRAARRNAARIEALLTDRSWRGGRRSS